MKRAINFLFLFTCIFISCKSNNRQKIIISSRYQDYKFYEKNAKEEVVRNVSYEFGRSNKNIPIDSAWTLPNPIIDELKDGEYLILLYQSSGCFHQETKNLIFKKSGSKIYGIIPGQLVVELTSGQIEKMRKFESILHQINNNTNYCTTVHSYRFFLGTRLRTYIDETCGDDVEPFSSISSNFALMGNPVE